MVPENLKRYPLTLTEWITRHKAGEDLSLVVVRKQYIADIKAVEGQDRSFECTISTATPDRDKDVVVQEGINTANFQANPVVLFGHQYSRPPVARSIKLWIEGGMWKSVMQFVPKGVYDFADVVEAMYRLGFMRALSIGFIPKKYAFDEERRGYDMIESELLEYSCVPVPANPEALSAAKSAGIDLAPLKTMLEEAIEDIDGPGLWVPKHIAIEALRIAAGEPKSVTVPAPAPEPAAVTIQLSKEAFQPTNEDFQAALTAAIDFATKSRVRHALGHVGD